jgi:rhodanese-related sulfurtransferase
MGGISTEATGVNIQTDNNQSSKLNGIYSQTFSDIEGHWCREYIEKFLNRNWVAGYDDGLFRPDRFVTRAEFTAMVVNIFRKVNSTENCNLTDVKEHDWFYNAVSYAASEKLVNGYEDGTFKPMNNMSRQDAAVLVTKLFDVNFFDGATEVRFADEDIFPEYSSKSIKNLASHDIVKGYPDKTFRPFNLITRAEAVRMLDVVLLYVEPVEEIPQIPPVSASPTVTVTTTATPIANNSRDKGGSNVKDKPISTPTSILTVSPTFTATPTSIPTTVPTLTSTPTSTPIVTPTLTPTPTPSPVFIGDFVAKSINTTSIYTDPLSLEISGSVCVEVYNDGHMDFAGNIEVLFFEDTNLNNLYDEYDTILGKTTVSSIPKGRTVQVHGEIFGKVLFRDNLIYFYVDSSNKVIETNEENNIIHSKEGCNYYPPVGSFNPVIEWKWDSSSVIPNYTNVITTPLVIDLDDDGIPEIVFGSYGPYNGGVSTYGALRALRGDTGEELFTVTDSNCLINAIFSLAAGDIDNDGKPEIIAGDTTLTRILAFENDGTLKWKSEALNILNAGIPAIADIDADGEAEIIIGRQVIDNNGKIKWTGKGGSADPYGVGAISFAVDIDMDNSLEVLCGNTVYDNKGEILWKNESVPDGFNAVGNFDEDEYPEIVLVSRGNVWILEHNGDIKMGPVSIPGGGKGGPPTVADFNQDGKVEIGVAGQARYAVFTGEGDILWAVPISDYSSNYTGSSVFDFEGDGSYEVVYRDEYNLRIYNGMNGDVLYEIPMTSLTSFEYPVIADVDSDGNAEIVAYANGIIRGIYVIGDANDTWVNTRKIWNQHAYSITNVNDDGTIPKIPDANWTIYNNFRCNQSLNSNACVDLSVSYLEIVEQSEKTVIKVRIGNCGAMETPKHVQVAFYDVESTKKELLGTVDINKQLYPGEYTDVEFSININLSEKHTIMVVVDDNGTGTGMVREINETNNWFEVEYKFSSQATVPPIIEQESVQAKNVTVQETIEMIKDDDVVIIDVRTSTEYNEEHLPNALNIDLNTEDMRNQVSKLDKSKKYLLYCRSGQRSQIASNIFIELGINKVYLLKGGIEAWKDAGCYIYLKVF